MVKDTTQRPTCPITGGESLVRVLSDSAENSQSIDAAKLEAQGYIALAIIRTAAAD
jgi:hypothetical protein